MESGPLTADRRPLELLFLSPAALENAGLPERTQIFVRVQRPDMWSMIFGSSLRTLRTLREIMSFFLSYLCVRGVSARDKDHFLSPALLEAQGSQRERNKFWMQTIGLRGHYFQAFSAYPAGSARDNVFLSFLLFTYSDSVRDE